MEDSKRGDGVFKTRVGSHNECMIQLPIVAIGSYYRRFTEDNGKRIVFEKV